MGILFHRAKMDFTESFWTEMDPVLNNPRVREMKNFNQHGDTSCYLHSLRVSRYSYYVCKFFGLEYMSAARGGMFHDMFLYDWQEEGMSGYAHLREHGKTALSCAEGQFELNPIERDVIENHMFPVTYKLPRFWESYIVSCVDKYCATVEATEFISRKIKKGSIRFMSKFMRYANMVLAATEY